MTVGQNGMHVFVYLFRGGGGLNKMKNKHDKVSSLKLNLKQNCNNSNSSQSTFDDFHE